MSAVDETIVREYFESHEFLVCQRRKYIVQARQKMAHEEVDLVVLNPRAVAGGEPLKFEIASESLDRVARAVVAVKGWHTEVFAPGVLAHQPKIFGFVEKGVLDKAARLVGGEGLLKILVVPGHPFNRIWIRLIRRWRYLDLVEPQYDKTMCPRRTAIRPSRDIVSMV